MFRKVEIIIPLLDAIKQVPKYAKFLKELCIYKTKKIKGGVKTGGIVLALVQNEGATTRSQSVLPKKCGDPRIFLAHRSRTDGNDDKLANKSVVQPLGILEDVLVQVNDLIFLVDFYVLDIED
ncbi:hypothetical protein CR513_45762, partial [Mucuna pruriens]